MQQLSVRVHDQYLVIDGWSEFILIQAYFTHVVASSVTKSETQTFESKLLHMLLALP